MNLTIMKMFGFFIAGIILSYDSPNGNIFQALMVGSATMILLSISFWFEEFVKWIWKGQDQHSVSTTEGSEQHPKS